MIRYISIVLAAAGFFGCATAKPTDPKLSEHEKLYQVVQLCQRLAVQHLRDPKYTNCRISKDRIHFEFADQATYMGEAQSVSSLVQTFCFASQGSAQRTLNLTYSWMFVKEHRGTARSCPTVDFVKAPSGFGEARK